MSAPIHIIGAGLAGLSAAVRLVEQGRQVVVHEAAGHAGGRCRSFHDKVLDRTIDNGNHLVLSGNLAAMRYLEAIGARGQMQGPAIAAFPFVDVGENCRWTVQPDRGAIPWSLLSKSRRVPGTSIGEYLSAWRLSRATATDRISGCLPVDGPLWRRFWQPVIVSIMNTDPTQASARLFWAVLKETFGRGEAACRPMIAVNGLSEAFVDPAIQFLTAHGAEVRLGERIRSLIVENGKVVGIEESDLVEKTSVDAVIAAVPPPAAAQLLPGLQVPDRFQPIVNGHFRVDEIDLDETFVGIVGGTAEWLFVRGDVVSTTVSAAAQLSDRTEEDIATALWADIVKVLQPQNTQLGRYRIIREKRATFEQTPDQVARRPGVQSGIQNLFLAGDWTDTGLPATIEGTIRSGFRAADAVASYSRSR